MSIYNSFITVKYNRLASPLENAPQASFHAGIQLFCKFLWPHHLHFTHENFSQPYCANWPQHLILFFSLWIKFLIPLIILLASVPNDDAYNPDFENAMNENKEVEYKLVYGITNDIHYLRSVFQNDASF